MSCHICVTQLVDPGIALKISMFPGTSRPLTVEEGQVTCFGQGTMGQWCIKIMEMEEVHQDAYNKDAWSIENLKPTYFHIILAILNTVSNTSFLPEKTHFGILKVGNNYCEYCCVLIICILVSN